jgi:hypothetical protein
LRYAGCQTHIELAQICCKPTEFPKSNLVLFTHRTNVLETRPAINQQGKWAKPFLGFWGI